MHSHDDTLLVVDHHRGHGVHGRRRRGDGSHQRGARRRPAPRAHGVGRREDEAMLRIRLQTFDPRGVDHLVLAQGARRLPLHGAAAAALRVYGRRLASHGDFAGDMGDEPVRCDVGSLEHADLVGEEREAASPPRADPSQLRGEAALHQEHRRRVLRRCRHPRGDEDRGRRLREAAGQRPVVGLHVEGVRAAGLHADVEAARAPGLAPPVYRRLAGHCGVDRRGLGVRRQLWAVRLLLEVLFGGVDEIGLGALPALVRRRTPLQPHHVDIPARHTALAGAPIEAACALPSRKQPGAEAARNGGRGDGGGDRHDGSGADDAEGVARPHLEAVRPRAWRQLVQPASALGRAEQLQPRTQRSLLRALRDLVGYAFGLLLAGDARCLGRVAPAATLRRAKDRHLVVLDDGAAVVRGRLPPHVDLGFLGLARQAREYHGPRRLGRREERRGAARLGQVGFARLPDLRHDLDPKETCGSLQGAVGQHQFGGVPRGFEEAHLGALLAVQVPGAAADSGDTEHVYVEPPRIGGSIFPPHRRPARMNIDDLDLRPAG
mmetsp:Transcript_106147/g.307153  ORF Transcript_106147/g.307153 Transcript_106147/m.307153 type:complete len:548 (-) Transcript_106147:354-1997(-)